MIKINTDICVIGGGSGGLSIAAGAAQMGVEVVLFEGHKMGGDCLNYGCVPSKALLAAARAARDSAGQEKMGIYSTPPDINFVEVKTHIAEIIAGIAPHDSVERFTGLGVRVIEEAAHFIDKNTVLGGGYEVNAKYFVIASGSRPMVPPIEGLDETPFHTNETIFTDSDLPEHLVVIGGGPIGVEMAEAHQRLGANVTIIEAERILGRDTPMLVDMLRDHLKREGITVLEGTKVIKVSGKKGDIKVTVEGRENGQEEIKATHVLVAVGRAPNLETLALESAGIKWSAKGIVTDKRLRTANKRVFAIGDVTGRQQFTHVANYHAGIVIRNILFKIPAKVNDRIVPWVTFTDPELAHVGMTLDEAHAMGLKAQQLVFSLKDNDRARADRRTEGGVVAVTSPRGVILGASVLAPHAGELIQPWSLAISSGLKIKSMASFIAPYPTYGEVNKRVAGSFYTKKLFSKRTQKIVRFLMRLPF